MTTLTKPRFLFLSLRRNILPIFFCLFVLFLLLFSQSNLAAAKNGLLLWANNVIPSLLPFFIATELLSYTNVVNKVGELFNWCMRPLFNVPGCGAYALIMGMISGYPVGAKIVTRFREENMCTKEEGERLLSFTNNSGPLFIIGTVGISLFGNTLIGFLLFITHILAGLTTGFCFRFWKLHSTNTTKHVVNTSVHTKKTVATFSNLGEVISKSIMSSIQTIVMIGGFVVLFSVILSILAKSHILGLFSNILQPIFQLFGVSNIQFPCGFLSGILELTNGISLIAQIPIKNISFSIIICAFLLGFGGISILLQVFSITSKSDVSIKPYIIGKFMQGIFAAFYTYIFIYCFPIFNLNL